MNPLIEKIYSTQSVEDAAGGRRALGRSPIHRDVGRMLYEVVRQNQARKTLEVGLAYGLSALHICQALSEQGGGLHTAIDPGQDASYESIGALNVERAGLAQHFRLVTEPSSLALPQLYRNGERFDFVFIDGNHTFDVVLLDFFYADCMLEVGGVIGFDDVWMLAVRKAVAFAMRNRAYELVPTPAPLSTAHWRRWATVGRRFLQDPFGRDIRLKLIPVNVCFLRKVADDNRPWNFHRRF